MRFTAAAYLSAPLTGENVLRVHGTIQIVVHDGHAVFKCTKALINEARSEGSTVERFELGRESTPQRRSPWYSSALEIDRRVTLESDDNGLPLFSPLLLCEEEGLPLQDETWIVQCHSQRR
jgi:hypothetical protein